MKPETLQMVQALSAVASFVVAVVAAFIAWAAVRISRRSVWFTGALESHSTLRLQMEARDKGVRVIWWDPTLQPVPKFPRHGEQVTLNEIYLSVPPEHRQQKKKLGYGILTRR